MIALLVPVLARLGVAQRLQRPLAIAAMVAATLLALTIAKSCYDRAVERRYEAKVAAQVTKATDAANDAANTNDAKRQAENARADEQLRGAIDDAATTHPEEVRRAAGPATRAVLGKLRERAPSPSPPAR